MLFQFLEARPHGGGLSPYRDIVAGPYVFLCQLPKAPASPVPLHGAAGRPGDGEAHPGVVAGRGVDHEAILATASPYSGDAIEVGGIPESRARSHRCR